MKTYKNFNEMFNANNKTNKSMSVFNTVEGTVQTTNGEEVGTFRIYPADFPYSNCYVFWGASSANESNTGYIAYYANSCYSGFTEKTPYNILKNHIDSMLAILPDIQIVEKNASGEIYCSRQLTKEEAQHIAYKINDILWRDVEKNKKAWDIDSTITFDLMFD